VLQHAVAECRNCRIVVGEMSHFIVMNKAIMRSCSVTMVCAGAQRRRQAHHFLASYQRI
jgi:hypothetical protein